EALGMRPLQAHCRRGLGTLYLKIEQPEQACDELSAAIDLYRAMDMTFWLPPAEAALAQIVGVVKVKARPGGGQERIVRLGSHICRESREQYLLHWARR